MRGTAWLVLACSGLVLTLGSRDGDACILAPPSAGILAQTVPSTGVLPVALYCYNSEGLCASPASSFEVLDAEGTVVSGSLLETVMGPEGGSHLTLAWVPDDGWTPGAQYQFRSLVVAANTTTVPFTVDDGVSSDAATFTVALEPSFDSGEPVACGTAETTCGAMEQFFYPELAQTVSLRATLDEGAVWSAQLVVSVKGTTASETLTSSEVGVAPGAALETTYVTDLLDTVQFTEQATEYCYQILARRFGQEETTVLAEGCIAHGELPSMGHIGDVNAYGFDRCDGPVAGYESLWCEWANTAGICTAENRASFAEQCESFDSVCVDTAGASPSSDSSSGCQLAAPGGSTTLGMQGLVGFIALVFLRRRGGRRETRRASPSSS